MYENLKNKKLLVVGSTPIDLTIINTAKELGIYVISVDNNTDYSKAIGKVAADEAWDIDYSDTEAVVSKANREGVDGIIAGYSEFRVLAASKIAKKLDLPFYLSEDQVILTRNKKTFKNLCNKHGIKTPKDYTNIYLLSKDLGNDINFPVIIKPADYGGRKGISVCNTAEDLTRAVETAYTFSQSRQILIEEFIEGTEFAAMYTIANGEAKLSCLNEKYITEDQEIVTGLCSFVLSPAYFLEQFIEECNQPILNLLKSIGAKNGVANFQGIYTGNDIYIFEMGYRINGNNDFVVTERLNNVNSLKMLINYSITGTMGPGIDNENPNFNKYNASIPIILHAGKINKFNYNKLFSCKEIYDIKSYYKEGDVIIEDGSTSQKAMLMRIEGENINDIEKVYDYIYKNLTIENENGKSMLFKPFNFSRLNNRFN